MCVYLTYAHSIVLKTQFCFFFFSSPSILLLKTYPGYCMDL